MTLLAHSATVQQVPAGTPDARDKQADFVAAVLGSTEDTWTRIFAQHGARYQPPRLVLFTDATPSACGTGQAAMGPFYCPGDQKVYIDLGFFRELGRRFGAPGDFARAYVVAHEVGHHIQNLTGVAEKVARGIVPRLAQRCELAAGAHGAVTSCAVRSLRWWRRSRLIAHRSPSLSGPDTHARHGRAAGVSGAAARRR